MFSKHILLIVSFSYDMFVSCCNFENASLVPNYRECLLLMLLQIHCINFKLLRICNSRLSMIYTFEGISETN